jgi:hypothetical protein
MDNPPIYKAKVATAKLSQIPIHLAPHPPYSPALASSDFFLFGYLQEKLFGFEFDSPEASLNRIQVVYTNPITGHSVSEVTETLSMDVSLLTTRFDD